MLSDQKTRGIRRKVHVLGDREVVLPRMCKGLRLIPSTANGKTATTLIIVTVHWF